jgi:exosortase D (VPLPA-CTERM-specific)
MLSKWMNMSSKNNAYMVLDYLLGGVLISTFLWFYWPTLTKLTGQLISDENYSFGLLLPLVSAYIIYLKLPQLRNIVWQRSWFGLFFIALSFLIYIMGDLVAIYYFPPISFIILIFGVLLLLGGWQVVSSLAFPIFLLFLMIPLPAMVVQQLTFHLQLLSSKLAASFLSALGYVLIRKGNVIDLGVRQLQIVDACSGLRYILSLFSLGMIYCYFYQRSLWKAAILLISLVPAAIIANALRIALMGIFPSLQEGFLHNFSGWLIFVICFVFLALINLTLDKQFPPGQASASPDSSVKAHPGKVLSPPSSKPATFYLLAALIVVLGLGPLAHRLALAPPVPLLQSFDKFPLQIDSFQGQRQYLDPDMAKVVGADDYFDAVYTSNPQQPVSLWIAYFENQNKKESGRIHSPLICLPGGGWQILESKIMDVSPGHPVRSLLIEQRGVKQVVFYWYFQRGRWLASEYPAKIYMGWDGLWRHRNDGAIVRLITPVEADVEAARNRLISLTKHLVSLLPRFIPQ